MWRSWQPPAIVRARNWIPANIVIPDQTETGGAFDLDLFPHVAGVLDAIDDPEVRVIVLRWAARNAKTTTAIAALVFFCAELPRPAMFGGPDEKRADDAIDSLLYPMLEACPATRKQLLPDRQRNKDSVIVGPTKIRKAFSGSPSTMAGFPAAYGVATEVAKWSRKKSSEARPTKLFQQRGKLFPFDSKYIYEGTPAAKDQCEITAMAEAAGTERRFRWVPCPHCGEYQRLQWGDRDPKSAGVKWEKDEKGKSDPIRAEATAWYRCAAKGCRIDDVDRPQMLRAGLWVPEGQRPDRRGKLLGQPLRVSSTVAFDELSTLYSLMIAGWGQLAREWVDAQSDPESIRDFVNSTLAKCWDPAPATVEPHELAARLKDDDAQRGVCPDWTRFVTLAADVGRIGETLLFYWGACAWGKDQRGQLVDYGIVHGEERFLAVLAEMSFARADESGDIRPVRIVVDASDGFSSNRIYQLCAKLPGAWPIKGSSTSSFPEVYRLAFQRTDVAAHELARKKRLGLGDLIEVNTHRSQEWIEDLIHGITRRDDPAWFGLPPEVCDDADLLDQLLAERADTSDKGNRVWTRTGDNEFRDVARYAWVAATHYCRGGKLWGDPPIAHAATAAATATHSGSWFAQQTRRR